MFFVVLSGGVNSFPENTVYFLRASTEGIKPAPSFKTASWTFFSLCGVDDNGRNANCGTTRAGLPFDPPNQRNFGTSDGIPADFIGTSRFFYLSRFMFAFYLMGLTFAALALFTGLLALCSRLGGYISGLLTAIALFFHTIAAALMT